MIVIADRIWEGRFIGNRKRAVLLYKYCILLIIDPEAGIHSSIIFNSIQKYTPVLLNDLL